MAPGPSHGLDVSSLDPAVQHFCQQGIATSTRKTYQSALNRFASFCSLYNVLTPFPVSESLLCYFSTHLACQKLSPQTIKVYLSAIRHMQITLGLPEPREFSSMPRLRLVQSGIQRTHATQQTETKVRLPITPTILLKLKEHWTPRKADADIVMLWAAASLCFFGFFRSGEITIPSLTSFDASKHLAWGDVAVDNTDNPLILKVHLKVSKTDQLGKGVDVYVGKTNCPLCPVTATLHYMTVRGAAAGPFFILKNRTPLTKSTFTARIREALQALGFPEENFAGHSFRIGAATAAASAGIEDSVIRTMGRWSSSAFLAYIRTPREQLATFSRSLATT